MEYIHLGRSGLSVSRICLGTMNFGPLTPATEAEAIMDHAHEIGINFFDTPRYGGTQSPPGALAQQAERIRGCPRRSSATVRVSGDAGHTVSLPSCTGRWVTGPTRASCRR
jgi:aryl-alcohol dehydrogenase-like predicted oxidoreductase